MSAKSLIFVVSDSVGETADLVARAAISQYNSGIEIRRYPLIVDPSSVREVVEAARANGALILYTIIVPELRQVMQQEVQRLDVPAVDLMGPVMDAIGRHTGREPKLEPGLLHRMDEQYFRRVDAVEFAVKYDDGKDPRGCLRADLVLLGVSRSSKTPVALYLAHQRLRVANIPLVPEVPVAKEVFQVPTGRVVGLRVAAEQLLHIRQERVRTMGLRAAPGYASIERIVQELEYAEEVYRKLGCPVVDVTNKAIEETAVRVLEIVTRGGRP